MRWAMLREKQWLVLNRALSRNPQKASKCFLHNEISKRISVNFTITSNSFRDLTRVKGCDRENEHARLTRRGLTGTRKERNAVITDRLETV